MFDRCVSLLICLCFLAWQIDGFGQDRRRVTVKKTVDFLIDGKGSAENWERTVWLKLDREEGNTNSYLTKAKMLYSDNGIYFLFYCEDKRMTATMKSDFLKLWEEDVIEVFLWPDLEKRNYFEYELSPLNFELPLLLSAGKVGYSAWVPFVEGDSVGIIHKVEILRNDNNLNGSSDDISSWTAEFFVPYRILGLLDSVPPVSGTSWRGNLYRIDYDGGYEANWSWSNTNGNFHRLEKFATFYFE